MENVVKRYVNEVLPTYFKKYEIPMNVIDIVIRDIENRISSCILHWNDITFRRVILTTGLEEASFYKPKSNLELRCFVVVAIRNSLFENLVSDKKAAMELGLSSSPIPEKDVKVFTQEAINYFIGVDFEKLCNTMTFDEMNDIYRDLKDKYPVAWKALSELGKWSNKGQVYDKLKYDEVELLELDNIKKSYGEKGKFRTEIQSGMDEKIGPELRDVLSGMAVDYQPFFYTDCFKNLTRNIDKLFKVIEYVLRKDCVFMTSNFYVSNGYVAKRKELLPPAHTNGDADINLRNFEGLHQTHLQAFKSLSLALRSKEKYLK